MKADERRLWREQADLLGWKHESVIGETTHVKLSDEERFEQAYRFAARHLVEEFRTAAVIDHEKLGLHAARGLIGAGIAGGPADIKRVVELTETRGIRIGDEHVSLVVGVFDDKLRASNTKQIRIEERLQSLAHATAQDRSGALASSNLRQAMDRSKVRFSRDQEAAIFALSSSFMTIPNSANLSCRRPGYDTKAFAGSMAGLEAAERVKLLITPREVSGRDIARRCRRQQRRPPRQTKRWLIRKPC